MMTTNDFFSKRRAGILLHITSLPGTPGNGTLGSQAYNFVDFIHNCGLSVWQVLPICPPHVLPPDKQGSFYQDFLSPYQCQSAHAGNSLLFSFSKL